MTWVDDLEADRLERERVKLSASLDRAAARQMNFDNSDMDRTPFGTMPSRQQVQRHIVKGDDKDAA